MGKTTGYYKPGEAGGYADPYPTGGRRRRGFLNQAGSARARMMEEQLKMEKLRYKMMLREYQRGSRVPVQQQNVISGGNPRDDSREKAYMMATQLKRSNPRSSTSARDLADMIYAIGIPRAHMGLMQSGQLFAQQTGSPTQSPAMKMAAGSARPNPYSGGGEGSQGESSGPYTRESSPNFVGPRRPDILGIQGSAMNKGLEKGTLPGTVPRTGQTIVHKGEVVVPENQVDSRLMSYLVADAANKRVPLGQKSSKGYQAGSLGEDEQFLDWMEQGSNRPNMGQDASFLRWWEEQMAKVPNESPKYVPPATKEYLLGKTKESKKKKGDLGSALGEAAGYVGRTGRDILGGLLGAGRALDEGMRGEDYSADVAGMVGPAEAANTAAVKQGNFERIRPLPPEVPAANPDPTGFKLAQQRVQGGDFGSKEDPLKLTGQLSEREEAYRELSGTPEQREARHEEGMARNKVKQLLHQLGKQGHAMDPEIKKSLMEQVQFHSQIASKWSGERREREKAVEEELKISEASAAAMEKAWELENQKIQGREDLARTKAEERGSLLDQRYAGQFLMKAYEGYRGSASVSERKRWHDQLALYINVAIARQGGDELSTEEALDAAERLVGLPPGEVETAIQALMQ